MNPRLAAIQYIQNGDLLKSLNIIELNNIFSLEDLAYYKYRVSMIESDFTKGVLSTGERITEVNKIAYSLLNRLKEDNIESDIYKIISKIKHDKKDILDCYSNLIITDKLLEINNPKWQWEKYGLYLYLIALISIELIGVGIFFIKPYFTNNIFYSEYTEEGINIFKWTIGIIFFIIFINIIEIYKNIKRTYSKISILYNAKKIIKLPDNQIFDIRHFDDGYGNLHFSELISDQHRIEIEIIDFSGKKLKIMTVKNKFDFYSMKYIFNVIYKKIVY